MAELAPVQLLVSPHMSRLPDNSILIFEHAWPQNGARPPVDCAVMFQSGL